MAFPLVCATDQHRPPVFSARAPPPSLLNAPDSRTVELLLFFPPLQSAFHLRAAGGGSFSEQQQGQLAWDQLPSPPRPDRKTRPDSPFGDKVRVSEQPCPPPPLPPPAPGRGGARPEYAKLN